MKKSINEKSYDDFCPGNKLNQTMDSSFWDRPSRLALPVFAETALVARRRGSVVFMHHRYPMCALEFILTGELTYLIDGVKIRAEAGDVFLLHHNSDSGFRNSADGYYEKRVLILAGPMRDALLESLGLRKINRIHPADGKGILARIEHIISLLMEKKEGTEYELASKTCDLLFALAAECRNEIFNGPENLRRTLTYIDSMLQRTLSMDELSAYCGVSPATLSRLFQKYLKCSLMEYLTEKRMEKARNLLRINDLPVKEVAMRCGYADQLYFSTVFRKAHGVSPRDYRVNDHSAGIL